jgi:hypothetical protein
MKEFKRKMHKIFPNIRIFDFWKFEISKQLKFSTFFIIHIPFHIEIFTILYGFSY